MKSNNGILDSKELEKRAKFWNKKTFRTFSKRELEHDSRNMQRLLAAMMEFTKEEVQDIRISRTWYKVGSPENVIKSAWEKDYEHALSILPKYKEC